MTEEKCHKVFGVDNTPQQFRTVHAKNYISYTPGHDRSEVLGAYDNWADTYHEDVQVPGFYGGPDIIVSAVRRHLPYPQNITIMDVAAGTGLVGQKLNALGFHVIDGVEPSEGMRRALISQACYRRIYPDFIDANKTDIPKNAYDCVLVCGGFCEGHIPTAGLNELHRITKKGGYVMIVLREDYLEYVEEFRGRLEPRMERMRDEGLWTSVERTVVKNYSSDKNGVLYVFQKC